MAKKTEPDLDKKMLNLTAAGVWVGILGLLTAVVLGYLQLRGGNQPPRTGKETKTIIYVHDSAGKEVPKQVESTTATQGAASTSGRHTTASGTKTSSGAAHETTAPKTVEPEKPSAEGTSTTTTPEPEPAKPRPVLTTLRPRLPGSLQPIKPINTAGSTSTATTPVKPIRMRKDLIKITP